MTDADNSALFKKRMMNVLVACEESQEVCKAFRARGHNAYSCDMLPCSGGYPEWHFIGNVLPVIKGGHFTTEAGTVIRIDKWDMMLAFPRCTYLTVAANRHFLGNPERWIKRLDAVKFVWELMQAPIPKIAIENPKGVLSTHIRKSDQYIHPYQFGDPVPKQTGLWLKGLPLLTSTNVVEPEYVEYHHGKTKSGVSRYSKIHGTTSSKNNPEVARLRSKTFPGIANAMAHQWG